MTRAGNVIGWVFLGMAAAATLTLPATAYIEAAFEVPYRPSLPGTEYAAWVVNLGPALIAMGIPMLFLLFPTDRRRIGAGDGSDGCGSQG